MNIWFVSDKKHADIAKNTAGVKARDDAEEIFLSEGFKPIYLETKDRFTMSKIEKLRWHIRLAFLWKKALIDLKPGDHLFIQFPFENHSVFLSPLFHKLQKRGVVVSVLIHDLESLRSQKLSDVKYTERLRMALEERLLHFSSHIIVHNEKMVSKMKDMGYGSDQLISLEIFDYYSSVKEDDLAAVSADSKDLPIVIAGSLKPEKAGYVYKLPMDLEFNIYGPGYIGMERKGIFYKGVFEPEDLLVSLHGSFGLVWDGSSINSCEGIYGEYMRINNPHKTSLYLAAGLPVIIWKEAALAQFIKENGCGISVNSLEEIHSKIQEISDEEYSEMKRNALETGKKLRQGSYLKKAISTILTL